MSLTVEHLAIEAATQLGAVLIEMAYDFVMAETSFDAAPPESFDFECCGEMLTVTITRQAQ